MIKNYNPTYLEREISELLKKLDVYEPWQLNEAFLAQIFEITFKTFIQAHAIIKDDVPFIFVTANKDKKIQREEFYNGLCFILRNTYPYWDNQEFILYVAIPYHMLKFVDFNDISKIIENMSDTFGITTKLCKDRLTRIYNNIKLENIS